MPVYVGHLKCAHCGVEILQQTNAYADEIEARERLTSLLLGYLMMLRIPCCRVCESNRTQVTISEREHYVWRSGPDGECTHLGDLWFELTGHRPGTDLGDGWMRALLPEDLHRLWDMHWRAVEKRRPYSMRFRLRRSDRSYIWMVTKGYPILETDNSFLRFWGFAFKLTE